MKIVLSVLLVSFIWCLVVFGSALFLWGAAFGEGAWTSNGPETLAGAILTVVLSSPLIVLGSLAICVLAGRGVISYKTAGVVTGSVAVSILALFAVGDYLTAKDIITADNLMRFHKFFLKMAGI